MLILATVLICFTYLSYSFWDNSTYLCFYTKTWIRNSGFQLSFTLCCLFLEEVKWLCCVLLSSDVSLLFNKQVYTLGGVTPTTDLWEERLWGLLMSSCPLLLHSMLLLACAEWAFSIQFWTCIYPTFPYFSFFAPSLAFSSQKRLWRRNWGFPVFRIF